MKVISYNTHQCYVKAKIMQDNCDGMWILTTSSRWLQRELLPLTSATRGHQCRLTKLQAISRIRCDCSSLESSTIGIVYRQQLLVLTLLTTSKTVWHPLGSGLWAHLAHMSHRQIIRRTRSFTRNVSKGCVCWVSLHPPWPIQIGNTMEFHNHETQSWWLHTYSLCFLS